MKTKWLLVALIAVLALVLLSILVTRPVSFDAAAWKQARLSANRDIRYQMHRDLVRILSSGDWSAGQVKELLGPPDIGGAPAGPFRYSLGRSKLVIIPWHQYYLLLVFDESGVLRDITIHPE